MQITLSRRTAICQSVVEFYVTGVAPLGPENHRLNFNLIYCRDSVRPFLRKLRYLHGLLQKYPTFFCENLVDLNEAHFHEPTWNLPKLTRIFSGNQ